MGRPQRSGFSGRNHGRCLRRFWPPWTSPLLPSALRDELEARLKGCRVAGAVIEARSHMSSMRSTRWVLARGPVQRLHLFFLSVIASFHIYNKDHIEVK